MIGLNKASESSKSAEIDGKTKKDIKKKKVYG